MKVFSFGGGVQSTAALVLAARGELEADVFLFADVGEDSENPDTVTYMRDVALPYAERHGIRFEVVRHLYKGEPETLLQHIYRPDRHGVPIPARLNGGAPVKRLCTSDWKIIPINAWLMQQGPGPHEISLGISLDEFQRMSSAINPKYPTITRVYPLIDRRMNRADCHALIESEGLPVPPKSSCWFCPYHSMRAWADLRDKKPDLFAASVRLEQRLNERIAHTPNHVFLTDRGMPLDRAVGTAKQLDLFGDDSCDSGYCFT